MYSRVHVTAENSAAPLICMSLNKNSVYCILNRSYKSCGGVFSSYSFDLFYEVQDESIRFLASAPERGFAVRHNNTW